MKLKDFQLKLKGAKMSIQKRKRCPMTHRLWVFACQACYNCGNSRFTGQEKRALRGIYLSSVPNDSGPHFYNSWHKILIFSLELEFYQKQLLSSLIPTFRAPYARQMKKVSNLRNLFCIVPIIVCFPNTLRIYKAFIVNSTSILQILDEFIICSTTLTNDDS